MDKPEVSSGRKSLEEAMLSSAILLLPIVHCASPCGFPLARRLSTRVLVVRAGQRADLEINNLNQQLQLTILQQLPLPETNSSPLKMDGLEVASKIGKPYFQVRTVSFREGIYF